MKKIIVSFALVAAWFIACGGGQEIPPEKMARIMVQIIKESKIKITDSTDLGDVKDAELEPYVKPEGVTPQDFKFTSKLYDRDKEKREKFGEVFGKLMMEELIKAMNDSAMVNKMLKDE